MNDFKDIHIGEYIRLRVEETGVEVSRICNFIKCSEKELQEIYTSKSIDSWILLRLSKILEYDFFRIYTQHLILYAPPGGGAKALSGKKSNLPQFRKNIYTKEIIDFILGLIKNGEKTAGQITEYYGIPRATLFKWMAKNP
ncbi:transposase [Chryseobacterium gossypii]|uniref:transposase n=1 Tax=Chryseobacterium gossypii TaxID=3231602 RepID=UPI0035242264